jgi:hypothetical protein
MNKKNKGIKERTLSEQKVMCSDCNDTIFTRKEDGSITCDSRCKEMKPRIYHDGIITRVRK